MHQLFRRGYPSPRSDHADIRYLCRLHSPPGTRKYYVVVSPVDIEPEIHVFKGRIGNVKVYNHLVDENTLFRPE